MKRFLLTALLLLAASQVFGQGGLRIIKNCPATADSGASYNCTYSATAVGPAGTTITIDSLTETSPYPGGTPADLPCLRDGVEVFSLLRGQSCGGSVTRTAATCGGTDVAATDRIDATWTDQDNNPGTSFDTDTITVLACTPTPTITPTPTVTPTPTGGAGPTPTPTIPPGTLSLSIQKTCESPAAAGSIVHCTFSVQNMNPHTAALTIRVFNDYPFPGGTTTEYQCFQGVLAVTRLERFGITGDTCTGAFTEAVNAVCPSTSTAIPDQLRVTGVADYSGAVFGVFSYNSSYTALGCTPTPTGTPTITPGGPTLTPTPTPTGATPTPTFTPGGPTLTPTPTITPGGPTLTPSSTPTPTWTPGFTPIASGTPTPTPTRTPTQAPVCGTLIRGKIRNTAGNVLTLNGTVWFELSENGNASCCTPPFQIGPIPPITFRVTNGAIAGGASLIGNDCITPATTYYRETLVSSEGAVVLRRNCVVTGAVWDVGTCTPPGAPACLACTPTPVPTPVIGGVPTPVPECQPLAIRTVTAGTYYVQDSDGIIFADTTAGNVTVMLPADPRPCRIIDVKKIAGNNSVIVNGNGHNIDGAATRTITDLYCVIEVTFESTFHWGILNLGLL